MPRRDNGATPALGGRLAWFIWSLAALSFAYGYFQRVAPSVMVQDLMREFAVGAAVLGNLSAIYFYLYAGLQLPVGMLVDRWGPRLTITAALLLAAAGSLVFALAGSVEAAYAGRAMVGVGSAVSFVAALVLAGRWFPPRRFAVMAGLTMLVAMGSAIGSQAPLAALVEAFGWRATMLAGALIALVIGLLVAMFVRDRPDWRTPHTAASRQRWSQLLPAVGQVMRSGPVWRASLFGCGLSATMQAFGGLWGVPYLMERYAMSRPESAFICSFIFVGWAIGSSLSGVISERLGRRKAPMIGAAIVHTAAVTALVLGPDMPPLATGLTIAMIGAAGSFMITAYAYVREISDARIEGAVSGFINTFTVGSGALFQPLIGLILDLNWTGATHEGTPVYSLEAYTLALIPLVIASFASILLAASLKETWCRRVPGPSMEAPSPRSPGSRA